MMQQTILIIDDDDMIRSLVQLYLEREGYRVIAAGNGPAGVDMYETENPDLVVLDIAMPEMSGFDVTTKIRAIEKRERRPHTPIIILTAYARSFFLSAGSAAGIDSYLTKPIAPEKLLEHIHQFLGKPETSEEE